MQSTSDNARIRKIRYRSTRRGTRELDELLGSAVNKFLQNPSNASDQQALKALEIIIDCDDPSLAAWLSEKQYYPLFMDSSSDLDADFGANFDADFGARCEKVAKELWRARKR